MKQSLRAKRMARRQRRMKQAAKLNLVSLMDIFTILVFFLLVNSSEVEVLQTDKSIKLPASISDQVPADSLIVMINDKDILVGGRRVGSVAEALASSADKIPALETELAYQASRARPLSEEEQQLGRAINIMGDQAIPYALLKKVMASCAAADYRNISLAVAHREAADSTGPES
jgi:biopolymer transport protein ExbD